MAKSQSGSVITYAHWASKMQSQVALSTTKAEYISLPSTLRDVIPLMDLAKELSDSSTLIFFALALTFFAMLLRITLASLKSIRFQWCILKLSISTFATIISENVSGKLRWSFMPSVQRIRWLICFPNHYHKIYYKSIANLCLECEEPHWPLTNSLKKITKNVVCF